MSGRIKALIALPAALKEIEQELKAEMEELVAFMNKQFQQIQLSPKPGVNCILSYEFRQISLEQLIQ